VAQDGTPYRCLLQTDVNLASPPLPDRCRTPRTASGQRFPTARSDRPLHRAADTTCPPPGVFAPNGVPEGHGARRRLHPDLVHRFYQEQYQLDGGRRTATSPAATPSA
jgi:phospholipase C